MTADVTVDVLLLCTFKKIAILSCPNEAVIYVMILIKITQKQLVFELTVNKCQTNCVLLY